MNTSPQLCGGGSKVCARGKYEEAEEDRWGERGASLGDSEAEELPTLVRAVCNVWLNFLSN